LAAVLSRGGQNARAWRFQSTFQRNLVFLDDFDRLTRDGRYWASGLPNPDELGEINIRDGRLQPFRYQELAHVIVPCRFHWEGADGGIFEEGEKVQDISALARSLDAVGLGYRKTALILEIKLY
jgi:hypothetical protein